jgi:hypothetical protein
MIGTMRTSPSSHLARRLSPPIERGSSFVEVAVAWRSYSLHGIHVVGYQGWFDCPGDGAGLVWVDWFVANENPNQSNANAVDEWPDTPELGMTSAPEPF